MKCNNCEGSGMICTSPDEDDECAACDGTGVTHDPADADVVSVPLTFNLDELRDMAVRQTVNRLTSEHAHAPLREAVKREAVKLCHESIRDQVALVVHEALHTPYTPTDAFGVAKGEPTTLREQLVAETRAALTRKSGAYGDRNGLEDSVKSVIKDAWERELRVEASKAVSEIKAGLQAQLTAEIGDAVARLLKVR